MITFCILTKGEYELKRLLDILCGQRILVIFDGDSMRDVPIWLSCHKALPTVAVRRLNGDFAAQRNHAHTIVPEGEWVCWLDSDEEIVPSVFIPRLKALTRVGCPIAVVRHNMMTKDGEQVDGLPVMESHVRAYKVGSGQWVGRLHETFEHRGLLPWQDNMLVVSHAKDVSRCADQHHFYEALKAKILVLSVSTTNLAGTVLKTEQVQAKYPLPANVQKAELSSDDFVGENGVLNYAKACNAMLDWARQSDCEWVILAGADGVFYKLGKLPESGFGMVDIAFLPEGEAAPEPGQTWAKMSWFVIRRDHFMQPWCRFDEEYKGLGYEDNDFTYLVMHPRVPDTACEIKMLHLGHPPRWKMEDELTLQNKARFDAKMKAR